MLLDSAPAGRMLAILMAALACVSPVSAQRETRQFERAVREARQETDTEAYRYKIDPELSVTERSMIDFGGFASFTAIFLTDSDDNARRLLQPEVTLYGRAIIDGAHSFFARARFQYQDFSEGDSFDGRGSRWTEPFLDRYWYEFDLRRAVQASEGRTIDYNFNVRVGRQFVDWGGGLALSEAIYAARPVVSIGRFDIEGLAGITPSDESITDFDASRRDYDDDTERGYFGGMLRYTTLSDHQFYGYVLHMPDYNSGDEPRIPLGIDVDFDYVATYLGIGAQGSFTSQLLYTGEFVYQFGHSESDPLRGPQEQEDISAWAARGQLTWAFRDPGQSTMFFETIFASGDDDRLITTDTVGGNEAGTDDNAFNSLGFANTGLAFAPAVSNIMVFRLGGRTEPFVGSELFEGLQLGLDLTATFKMDPDAPIEEPTHDKSFLGFEPDFVANWRVTSDLTIVTRVGLFFPGDAIETTSSVRQFIFFGATLSF